MPPSFAFNHPDDALVALAERLSMVGNKTTMTIDSACGRILAQAVLADRDSPAADVSAMDGFAIRIGQLQGDAPIRIVGQSVPGSPAPKMPDDGVIQIFTGAIVPGGAEAVIKREDTQELGSEVRFRASALGTKRGEHIRVAGENAARGSEVIASGTPLQPPAVAVAASFGCFDVDVFEQVKVAIITTGDEVGLFSDVPPQPWQLRNSNRFAIAAILDRHPWINVASMVHCPDDRQPLRDEIDRQLQACDAVLMTGGVSMGDYDYVPEIVAEVGGGIVFHGLPIRPGKPILGAACEGKLILGLPGNPVSAAVGCRRMALPLLMKISGQTHWNPKTPAMRIANGGDKTLPLHWMRLVKLTHHGIGEPVMTAGSGDLVSLAHSDGFVELPPDATGSGPWPFYAW